MQNRSRILTVAGIALAAVGFMPSAHAAPDARPCVSMNEFNHIQPNTRAKLENLWEVRGRGVRIKRTDPLPLGFRENWVEGLTLIRYRMCGYTRPNAGVFVYYDRDDNRWALASTWVVGQSPIVPTTDPVVIPYP